jgi:hypothetical protein
MITTVVYLQAQTFRAKLSFAATLKLTSLGTGLETAVFNKMFPQVPLGVSFLQVFLPKFCMQILLYSYIMQAAALPCLVYHFHLIILLIFSEMYNYGAPHYAAFSRLLSLLPSEL